MKFESLVDIARALLDKPVGKNLHYSFILYKNKIRSIGWNNVLHTHPLSYRYNKKWPFIHSEVSSIIRFDGRPKELKDCTLINIRLNKFGKIMQSKPCKNCLRLVAEFNFDRVFYTNTLGQFERL